MERSEDNMKQCLLTTGDAYDHRETPADHLCKKSLDEDLKLFTYDELKRATMGFGYKTRLGDWSFGKVYKGWIDEMTYCPTEVDMGMAVVIKTFEHKDPPILKKSKLDKVLKKLNHPNLVKLIGYCIESESLFRVDEFIQYGNFEDCLRYGTITRLPLDTKVKMALGIARAIVFLHRTNYQSASDGSCAENMFLFERYNILLDEEFTAKLSDYNVPTFRPRDFSIIDCDIVHPAHNPPPSLYGWNNLTSFTMVLAEILTGEPVSQTNRLIQMHFSRHTTKEILKDPESLGSVANLCFEICNDVDSESKMIRLLKKFDKHIQTCQNGELTTTLTKS